MPADTAPKQPDDDARPEADAAPASDPAPLVPAAPAAPITPTPVLPSQSREDTDAGWGDYGDHDNDERLLRDRPPHWGNG
jgi:hypothetical protein